MDLNASLVQGNTFDLYFNVVDSAGAAVNLSTATAIKYAIGNSAGTTVIAKTLGSGVTVTNAAAGQFKVNLTAADTASLEGTYRHEAVITFADGSVNTVVADAAVNYGTITVRKRIATA